MSMGNNAGKDTFERDLFYVSDENGFSLSGKLLNSDVLGTIFENVYLPDLLQCRLVCKSWANIIDSEAVKLRLLKNKKYEKNGKLKKLPWFLQYLVLSKDFLNRNLLKNPDGSESYVESESRDGRCVLPRCCTGWEFKSNGGHNFAVEKPPAGSQSPAPRETCFVTSFHSCTKEQLIRLRDVGAAPRFLDLVQPNIVISEWYCGRFDCRAVYDLQVVLVKDNKEVADEFVFRGNVGGEHGNEWRQVTHTFKNYGPGVEYIVFYHGGVDEQFWAGHYGSKMTGASVVLTLADD